MILIPFPDTRLYLPSTPPRGPSLPRAPMKLRKRLTTADPGIVVPKQAKKGTVKKLLEKPRVVVGALKSVLAKVPKAKKHHDPPSDVSTDTDSVVSASDDTSSADSSEDESAIASEEVEIGDGVEDEVVTGDSSVAPLDDVEGVVEEEDIPVFEVVPDTIPEDAPGTQLLPDEEGDGCIACILGIGHGISDVESDVSQVEDSLASTEPGSEVPAPILDEETKAISSVQVVDEAEVTEVNGFVAVENESSIPQDTVVEQAGDSTESLEVALVVYANAGTTTEDLSYVSLDPIPTPDTSDALVVYANAGTTTEDLSYVSLDPIPTPNTADTPSPSVPALLDPRPVATSVDIPVDAHNEVSTEGRTKTLTALIQEAVSRISDTTGLPPSTIIQFAANLYFHEVLVPSAAQPATPEAPAPAKVTAEVSIQTDDVPISTEETEEEVDGCIISPMTAKEREEEFELIDRVMRGARARKRAALDVGEQMIWFGIEDKILNEKYFLIIQTASIPDVFKLLPPKPVIPVFELEDVPDEPAPPPPPPPGPPPPPPPAALAPPPLVSCGRKTLALPAPSSDTPATADPSAPSASSTPPAPSPDPAADRKAQEAAKAKAREELRAAIMQRQENGLGLRNAQDRVLRPAEPKSEVAPWQQEMLRRNGGDSSRTDNIAGPSRVQQESDAEPNLRIQLRATGRSLVDAPTQQTGSDDTPDNVAGPSEVQQESNAEPYVRPLFGLRPTGRSLVDEPNVQLNVQPRFQLRATGRSLVDEPGPAQQSGSDDMPDNVAGPSEVQQEPNAESYVRPLFGLRATGRSLVNETTQQTRSDDAPGMDISNLRANLRRTGRDIGNENEGILRRLRKGKGVSRPPLQSVNGPREGSA
ncbi:hypothetical protein NLI96_g6934 [Meripilus lineatus]|uniref:Uncharacterized protein n=1 Tax=Meripilus lineatus TaxID=2056292 RepID=A0AAD5V2C5_9APHY|nr:hypothetical protein NLI96_g6934 [Physisporinus lineatus]